MSELPRKEELMKKTKLDLFKPMLINLSNQGFRSQQELLEEEDEVEEVGESSRRGGNDVERIQSTTS